MTIAVFISLGTLALCATACGDIAYKAGADANQLRQDEDLCNASADAPRCMSDKGWTIAKLGGEATTADSISPMSAPSVSPSLADASPQPPTDPLRLVAISGWAHFGGGSPDQDLSDCVAVLGPAHRPDSANHRVTFALLGCMKGKNWQAL